VNLVVPFTGALLAEDARLIRLAEFLGISCQALALPPDIYQPAEFLESAVPESNSCVVVNPRVMRTWVGVTIFPNDLASCLTSRFSHLIVHGLRPEPFDASVVASLSQGRIQSVEPAGEVGRYEIDRNSKDICG
jgi:hypothetical protein